ncbi:hypothetical protein KL923_004724 [Ogataea haglerorum]|nr:hypothetical protein KL923_004724 [Ogataea haglerorum]KAG7798313.1 hypothetical protein KL944_004455 [Ogataea haglerorum]
MAQRTLNYDKLQELFAASDQVDEFRIKEPASKTIESQMEVEMDILKIYEDILGQDKSQFPILRSKSHSKYINAFLSRPLPAPFTALDASQPWIVYWLVNSKALLGEEIDPELSERVGYKILECVDAETGAIGGGSGQMAHLAATYAGLLALTVSKSYNAAAQLDRRKIYNWLLQMKQPDGSFIMHYNGEADTRAVYCAICVASLLDILDDKLAYKTIDWLASCQTYEGGFSGYPGDEAHGGYTFCAVAALSMLRSPTELPSVIDLDNLISWTVQRQYNVEGGLSGRTNKLVDGCYSHWAGGLTPLLEIATGQRDLLNRIQLQNYILCCCQDEPAGLRDKPSTRADFYHTNYVLCGLSMTQHYQEYKDGTYTGHRIADPSITDILDVNQVRSLDPIYGVPNGMASQMIALYRA